MSSAHPLPAVHGATRQHIVLIDTMDRYDAWNTGRDGPESHEDGDGLYVAYDGTGSSPCVAVTGPDGAVEFRGLPEIRAMFNALKIATRLAEQFGPPIPLERWRQLNG